MKCIYCNNNFIPSIHESFRDYRKKIDACPCNWCGKLNFEPVERKKKRYKRIFTNNKISS